MVLNMTLNGCRLKPLHVRNYISSMQSLKRYKAFKKLKRRNFVGLAFFDIPHAATHVQCNACPYNLLRFL